MQVEKKSLNFSIQFSTTTDYVTGRNNYYTRESSSRAVEISYELKKKILRDTPKNNIDLIYEGDKLTLTCAVPNDQDWLVNIPMKYCFD